MNANARLERRCQAPQPRSGAPKAQGLIVRSSRSTIRHAVDRCCRRDRRQISTSPAAFDDPSTTVPNLHSLDGRDLPSNGSDGGNLSEKG